MITLTKKAMFSLAIGAFISIFSFGSSLAADSKVIELTYGGPWMPPHPFGVAAQAWIEQIHQATNGRVHIEPYWGDTLLSKSSPLREIGKGVADIGYAGFTSPGGVELNYYMGSMSMVGKSSDPEVAMNATITLYDTMPEFKEELKRFNVIPVGTGNPMPRQLISIKPVRSLSDLKGMSIRAKGYEQLFKQFGATTSVLPVGDIYVALEKGTLDAIFLPFEIMKALRFAEVAKYVNNDLYAPWVPQLMHVMNIDSFEKMPADIQKIFMDNFLHFSQENLKAFINSDSGAKDFAKSQGVEYTSLPAEEVARWQKACRESALEIAKDIEKNTQKPAIQVVDKLEQLISK